MVHRRVVVDLAPLVRTEGTAGVGVKRLTAQLGRLRDVHDALRAGEESFRWPHLVLPDDGAVEAVVALAGELRARATTLAVVGQPGALLALRVWTDALAPGARIRWIGSPDAELLAPLHGADVAWLVLEGPSWADRVAEEAVARGQAVAVAGPGQGQAPPDGWWIADPAAGDGRFGALGMAGLVMAAWAGIDVGAAVAGARDMAESCRRAALFENPAYSLATASIAVQQATAIVVPAFLATSARLGAFTTWVARLWAAVGAQPAMVNGVRQHVGGNAVAGILGDDELTQALLSGTRDKWAVLWEVDSTSAPGTPGELAARQVRVFAQLWGREGLPMVKVRLPGLDAATLGGAIQLACHTAVTTSLMQERDPLGLEAVTTWHGAVERVDDDVDVGARPA